MKRKISRIVKEESVKLSEAEKILACSRKTLYRCIKAGTLKVFKVNGTGPYKVMLSELENLKRVIVRENMTFPKQTSANVRVCPQNFNAKNKSSKSK